MSSSAYGKLINLAAEMLKRQNMPRPGEWGWPESGKFWKIWGRAEKAQLAANEQCRLWAIAIKDVADSLSVAPGLLDAAKKVDALCIQSDAHKLLREAISKAMITPTSTECAWTENMDGAWETACNGIFEITDGCPSENEMRFCAYCGGRIVETRFNWDAEPIE